MNAHFITPIAETPDSVTLRREDFEALAELIADAQDLADADALKARLAAGETEAFPFELAERLLDGDHPVTVFREHRGFTARGLAGTAGVAPSYLSEIETGKKPGSLDAMARIASALKVPLDLLVRAQDTGRLLVQRQGDWCEVELKAVRAGDVCIDQETGQWKRAASDARRQGTNGAWLVVWDPIPE